MDRSQPKYHVLIVSINSSIRLEFQSYLHKILGAHIAFDTIGLEQVQRPEQIKGNIGSQYLVEITLEFKAYAGIDADNEHMVFWLATVHGPSS